ncbi:MAG: GNAT family N-acetyltransferase [Rhodococcus sp. (in: high G+C Gram-positive bacteria)]
MFRRVTEADFPLICRWLSQPHVARWWNQDHSPEGVSRDFGPAARAEEPSEDFLALLGNEPVALIQRCRWHDYPEYVAELEPSWSVASEAVTVDYLIGDSDRVGRGLGTRMLTEFVDDTWRAYPLCPSIIVPVATANTASRRVLEKSGFRHVTDADLEPDNPIDPRDHAVYSIDRPDRA